MGNEQAIPQQNQANQTGFQAASDSIPVSQSSSQNYLLSDSFIQQSYTYDYKMTVVIRGTRKTGKTTLITRMRGFPFDPEYQATPSNETTEIPWKSPSRENILVSALDTVEHSLSKTNSKKSKGSSQMDAANVDTLEKADAVVIMIDNRSDESIDLAEKLIINSPDNLPLAVFSNFMDLEDSSPLIPTKLMQYMGRFYFIPGSLKVNQGLIELSKWLALPLLSAKAKHAYSLQLQSEQEAKDLEAGFNKYTLDFLDLNTALSHLKSAKKENSQTTTNSSASATIEHGHTYKKAYQRRPLRRTQQNNSTKENQQKTTTISNVQDQNSKISTQNTKSADDSFWDDDDNDNTKSANSTRVLKKRVVKKSLSNPDDDEDEVIKPNPLVKPLRSSSNQISFQNRVVQQTVTISTNTNINASSSQENETTKRRKVIKRRSTNPTVSQQQVQQQTQQNQQPHLVVRRKKKVVRHSQSNNNDTVNTTSADNEPSVDGYESF